MSLLLFDADQDDFNDRMRNMMFMLSHGYHNHHRHAYYSPRSGSSSSHLRHYNNDNHTQIFNDAFGGNIPTSSTFPSVLMNDWSNDDDDIILSSSSTSIMNKHDDVDKSRDYNNYYSNEVSSSGGGGNDDDSMMMMMSSTADGVPNECSTQARRHSSRGRIIPIQQKEQYVNNNISNSNKQRSLQHQEQQYASTDGQFVTCHNDSWLVDLTSENDDDYDEEFVPHQDMNKKNKQQQHQINVNKPKRREYDGRNIPSHLQSTLRRHFERLIDVPSDGHCGYHVLMDGLASHNLLPPYIRSISDFRKAIVQYAIQNKTKLLMSCPNNYFHARGVWNFRNDDEQKTRQVKQFINDLEQIYNPSKTTATADYAYQDGVDYYDMPVSQEDWIKSYVVMPLVSQMFGINIWILSVHGDDYGCYETSSSSSSSSKEYTTMFRYRPDMDNVECIRYDDCAKFPPFNEERGKDGDDDILTPTTKTTTTTSTVPTIYTLHVNQNHYVRGVPYT